MIQFLIIFVVSQMIAFCLAQSSSIVYRSNIKEIQKGANDVESTILELVKKKDALKKTLDRISNEICGQCSVILNSLDCDCRKLDPRKDWLAFIKLGTIIMAYISFLLVLHLNIKLFIVTRLATVVVGMLLREGKMEVLALKGNGMSTKQVLEISEVNFGLATTTLIV